MEVYEELRLDRERGSQRLVAEYGNRLYSAACLLCDNDTDAEELVFRTLEQAIVKIKQYNPQYAFFTWLYAIMRNFRKMDLRKRRIGIVSVGTAEDLPEVAVESFAQQLETSDNSEIEQAVRSLSAALREVVVLHYYYEKSVEEIGTMLSLPQGTVKSRLHNARAALSKYLKEKGRGSYV